MTSREKTYAEFTLVYYTCISPEVTVAVGLWPFVKYKPIRTKISDTFRPNQKCFVIHVSGFKLKTVTHAMIHQTRPLVRTPNIWRWHHWYKCRLSYQKGLGPCVSSKCKHLTYTVTSVGSCRIIINTDKELKWLFCKPSQKNKLMDTQNCNR